MNEESETHLTDSVPTENVAEAEIEITAVKLVVNAAEYTGLNFNFNFNFNLKSLSVISVLTQIRLKGDYHSMLG